MYRGSTEANLSRNRKGIHPVTIAVIIIVMVIIIAGIVYLWMSMQGIAGHAIIVQNVHFQETKTTIHVQNIGEGTVEIALVQINSEEFNINEANCTVASEKTTTVNKGQTAEVTVNQAYHKEVHIKVVCKDGTFYESDWKP